MQIKLGTKPYAAMQTDALVSYLFEETDPVQGRIAEIDQAANGLLRKLSKSGELTGKTLEMTLIHAPAGLKAAGFENDKYKTDKKNDKSIDSVSLAGYSDAARAAGEKGLARGCVIADAQNFTRDLVNEPSNKLTPRILAERAEAMAREAGLAVEILDEKRIAELK